ncbi:hypothetical protein KORDIASMS9_03648 [Kordia sp. SMS9]|nr:hypothetical protein KORDIASMS9_03648 [Kordia sp. SMS9]
MKKRNLKTLKITKTVISNFDKQKIKGGTNTSVLEFSFCCGVDKH